MGILVFLSTKRVMTPPAVSIPRDSGVTSISRTSWIRVSLDPLRMAAWTAAPYATASSGLIDKLSVLPLKNSCKGTPKAYYSGQL